MKDDDEVRHRFREDLGTGQVHTVADQKVVVIWKDGSRLVHDRHMLVLVSPPATLETLTQRIAELEKRLG